MVSTILDQYTTSIFCDIFFRKMTSGSHCGWPKITFNRISHHFRSIRNLYIFLNFTKWPPTTILELRFRPFWITKNHFRLHFSPFQINTQLFCNECVRSLCDLKSQHRSFEQFDATDFARTVVHDHPRSPTTSATSRTISLRSSHDSNIIRSQLGRKPGVTGALHTRHINLTI